MNEQAKLYYALDYVVTDIVVKAARLVREVDRLPHDIDIRQSAEHIMVGELQSYAKGRLQELMGSPPEQQDKLDLTNKGENYDPTT